jgi:endonuclease-3
MVEPAIVRVHRLLTVCYGRPAARPRQPLLDVLVETILSQNTSDANSLRAFRSLRTRFPDWTSARRAGARAIAGAIRSGGLSNIKSRRIHQILTMLGRSPGKLSLEHLTERDPEEAYQSLISIKGVGPKTAACTLLFGAGIPMFPVDTHIYRVSLRLGWVKPGEDRPAFQERFRHQVPDGIVYPLHLNLIDHGRRVCRPAKPGCRECCLSKICEQGKGLA